MINPLQSIKNRVIIANNAKADFFTSIHHNSVLNMLNIKGIETYIVHNIKVRF